MRSYGSILALIAIGMLLETPDGAVATAQAPARQSAVAGAKSPADHADGTLLQVMRGILFPNSNVIFNAQKDNPASAKKDADPTMSTNPMTGSYGGWEAVENSSIALAEAANLLTIPGRVCSNGKPVPIGNADWIKFVQGLREAGMAAYKAAHSKSQDAVVDVSDTVTTACQNCHDVYREKTEKQGGMAARCTK